MSILAVAFAAAIATVELTIPGPKGALGAAWTDPGPDAPAVILIPGSGPTNRDGDNPLGVKGAIYRQLADSLAERGVATLRIDKRGLFSSKAAVADANAVRIADYAQDVRGWVRALQARGKRCSWIAGHSEGGLVALAAAQEPAGICGLILLSSPGRPLGQAMREQLKAQLPDAMFAPTEQAIATLEGGGTVDPATVPAPIAPLFNPALQGFLGNMLRLDPARLAASTRLPMLIVHGETDLQTSTADARALAAARPDARLLLLPGVNHVWKSAPAERAANMASYGNADARIDPAVATAIAQFVLPRD